MAEDLEVPSGWRAAQLRDFGHLTDGDWILNENYADDGVRLLQVGDVGVGRLIAKSNRYISEATAEELKCTRLRKGQVLISRMPEPIGRACVVPELPYEAITAVDVTILTPDRKVVDPEFAMWALNSDINLYQCEQLATGVTRQRVSRNNLSRVHLPLPPLPEQQRIAQVLSTVQEAIAQQERLIRTTTELKQALMQKLFTEGLRGEALKETEIGRVPESWEVVKIGDVTTIRSSSMSYSELVSSSSVEDGVPAMGVKVSDMNLAGNEKEFLTANLLRNLPSGIASRKAVPSGTVVFPKRGAAIATNKKRIATCPTVLDPNLIGVTPSEFVNSRYLYHWFDTFDLRKITDPGPTPQLNKKDIAPLRMPLPSMEEQVEVATTIDTIDQKLTTIAARRSALQDLFRTLLHELMTGKVRVSSLN